MKDLCRDDQNWDVYQRSYKEWSTDGGVKARGKTKAVMRGRVMFQRGKKKYKARSCNNREWKEVGYRKSEESAQAGNEQFERHRCAVLRVLTPAIAFDTFHREVGQESGFKRGLQL